MVLSLALFFGVRASTTASTSRAARCSRCSRSRARPTSAQLREKLGKLGLGAVQIQSFGAPTDVLIRVEQQPGGEAAQQVALEEGRDALADQYTQRRVEVVGPAVSSELQA